MAASKDIFPVTRHKNDHEILAGICTGGLRTLVGEMAVLQKKMERLTVIQEQLLVEMSDSQRAELLAELKKLAQQVSPYPEPESSELVIDYAREEDTSEEDTPEEDTPERSIRESTDAAKFIASMMGATLKAARDVVTSLGKDKGKSLRTTYNPDTEVNTQSQYTAFWSPHKTTATARFEFTSTLSTHQNADPNTTPSL